MRVAGGIGTTIENLDQAANGEDEEIEDIYSRFIREAQEDERKDAVASFQFALERETHHRAMFKEAFLSFKGERLVSE